MIFEEQYKVDEDTGCWNWTGRFLKTTPMFSQAVARRYSWEQKHGPLAKSQHIFIKCFNQKCVNPEHLTDDKEELVLLRFRRFTTEHPSGCWIWDGPTTDTGAPLLATGQTSEYHSSSPRKWAYRKWNGEAGQYSRIGAVCGDDKCVSPIHSFVWDFETIRGYELCVRQHPQIPSNQARNRRTGQVVCATCIREQAKGIS